MGKLLVICGPTATGKTKLALGLSESLHGELISADSRQVYKGMDIGTGKDRPKDITVWGLDIADPKEEFSVSEYQKFAREKILEIWKRGRLPILVGGTGFYISAVIDGIDTIAIPKDESLRKKLTTNNTDELFEILLHANSEKAKSLNDSDKRNPARLIRAIEVAKSKSDAKDTELSADILFIGLRSDKTKLDNLIKARVEQRLSLGFEQEVEDLLARGVRWEDQSMKSLGYRQWRDYKLGLMTKETAVSSWIREEQKYAKRQLTWFNRDPRIVWFDIFEGHWQENVEKLVLTWYHK